MFEDKKKLLLSSKSSTVTDSTYTCKPCRKVFQSKETYETHLVSNKHKKKVKVNPEGPESTDAASSDNLSNSEIVSSAT